MEFVCNDGKCVSYVNSKSTSYTIGITSSAMSVFVMKGLEACSSGKADILVELTAIDLLILQSVASLQKSIGDALERQNTRFLLGYNLLSTTYNYRVQVLTKLTHVTYYNTVSSLHQCAEGLEREMWDLFGLIAALNRDLRRILCDYGFEGHPLRKDFPLMGFLEVYYNEFFKRIFYGPVEIMQTFRLFRFVL